MQSLYFWDVQFKFVFVSIFFLRLDSLKSICENHRYIALQRNNEPILKHCLKHKLFLQLNSMQVKYTIFTDSLLPHLTELHFIFIVIRTIMISIQIVCVYVYNVLCLLLAYIIYATKWAINKLCFQLLRSSSGRFLLVSF